MTDAAPFQISAPSDHDRPRSDSFAQGNPVPAHIDPRAATVTSDQWLNFIGLIGSGTCKVKDAQLQAGLTRWQVDGLIRTSVKARSEYNNAKLAALRGRWPLETIEEILEQLALGMHGGTIRGVSEANMIPVQDMVNMIHKDPTTKALYEAARMVQADFLADETMDIADNTEGDVWIDDDGKMRTNHETVKRGDLRIRTRNTLMKAFSRKRFGDKQQIDANVNLNVDHADRLEAARKRFEARTGRTINHDTGEVD